MTTPFIHTRGVALTAGRITYLAIRLHASSSDFSLLHFIFFLFLTVIFEYMIEPFLRAVSQI